MLAEHGEQFRTYLSSYSGDSRGNDEVIAQGIMYYFKGSYWPRIRRGVPVPLRATVDSLNGWWISLSTISIPDRDAKTFLFCLVFFHFSQKARTSLLFDKGNLFQKESFFSMGYNANTQWRDTLKVNSNAFVASLGAIWSCGHCLFHSILLYRTGQFSSGFDNPFIRFGISPYYKWIRLHVGHRSMQFSNYSPTALPFCGFGTQSRHIQVGSHTAISRRPTITWIHWLYYANLIQAITKRKAHGVKLALERPKILGHLLPQSERQLWR